MTTQLADQPTVKILLVDDHPPVREGLAAWIAGQENLTVCGEADSVESALKQIRSTAPLVVVTDLHLLESDGLELIKRISRDFPGIRTLVVSELDEGIYAERALRAGAHGFLHKREAREVFLEALQTVLEGRRYVSPNMTQQLVRQAIGGRVSSEADPVSSLSARELEVFKLIGHGKRTAAIAKQLNLSVHTIESHREKLRRKLDVANSAELMRQAVQWVMQNSA